MDRVGPRRGLGRKVITVGGIADSSSSLAASQHGRQSHSDYSSIGSQLMDQSDSDPIQTGISAVYVWIPVERIGIALVC